MGNCQHCTETDQNKTQEILTTRTTKNKQTNSKKLTKLDIKGLIKIQANFKGYITRKKYQFKFSRSTAQKHSSSIMNQKSSQYDSVITDNQQLKPTHLQIQSTIKKLPPRKEEEQQQKQFGNADITININKEIKDDISSISEVSRPASNLVALSQELSGLCFVPLKKSDQQLVQVEQQQKLPILQLQNGAYYEGQWKNGMVHGFGKYVLSDTAFYIGDWVENKANGFGTFQHSNGDSFMGNWVEGTVSGKGKYTYSDGSQYDGEWSNDLPNGQGTQTYGGGWIYEGSFQDGSKYGKGKLIFPDGSLYEGKFENDLMSGFGTLSFMDGRYYQGEWKYGMKNGKGIFEWPDGRRYEGSYVNDLREGYGVLQWPNGQKYLGLWKKGLQHGNGQIVKNSGVSFRGKWIKGKIASTKLTTNTPAKVVKLSNE